MLKQQCKITERLMIDMWNHYEKKCLYYIIKNINSDIMHAIIWLDTHFKVLKIS